jgi:hypothetical protein
VNKSNFLLLLDEVKTVLAYLQKRKYNAVSEGELQNWRITVYGHETAGNFCDRL